MAYYGEYQGDEQEYNERGRNVKQLLIQVLSLSIQLSIFLTIQNHFF